MFRSHKIPTVQMDLTFSNAFETTVTTWNPAQIASDKQQSLIFQKFKGRVRLLQGQSYKIMRLSEEDCNYRDKQSTADWNKFNS